MEEPLKALIQSFSRTKAKNLAEYKQVMEAHTNSSNNTLYADADGNIAYFHSNFVPKRNPKLDWTKPVDGSVPANDWQGVHAVRRQPERREPAERLGLQHQQLAVHRRRPRQPRRRATSPPTSTAMARIRAASTPCAC